MTFNFSNRSKMRMDGVHPDLILIFEESIIISPIDFGIPGDGGVRTAERQHEMFLSSSIQTNCDGYNQISEHQFKADGYGHALDFYVWIAGKASWQTHHLAMVAATLMITAGRLKQEKKIRHDFIWGGTFGSNDLSGWDMPHTQIKRASQ